MKLAILHTRLSGYLAACLSELKQATGAEFLVHAYPGRENAPFDASQFSELGVIHNRRERSIDQMWESINEFQPEVVLVSGWADKGYLKLCRRLRKQGIPVIAGCDTQWKGNLKQHAASWVAPSYLHKAIDVLWVSGERQATLARALGYHGDRLWDGFYACDWERFATIGRDRLNSPRTLTDEQASANKKRTFFYVGRYAPEKGLDTLAEAYRIYCQTTDHPWELVTAGAGPLRDVLIDAGAEDRGFIQPSKLPALMRDADAFVLPSRFEPWGVVLHEAAAAGLPLICSDACGAGVHLLREHFNGFTFSAGKAKELATSLERTSRATDIEREALGAASFELSKQYTPQQWVKILVEGVGGWNNHR